MYTIRINSDFCGKENSFHMYCIPFFQQVQNVLGLSSNIVLLHWSMYLISISLYAENW